MKWLDAIAQSMKEGRSIVIATVADQVGSSPRKAGAKMLVFEDGTTEGTIGGGALEKQVTEDARKLFSNPDNGLKTYDLTRELGMCCGGKVTIFFEVLGTKDPLLLFGAGHIAKPLAAIAATAGFDVTVIDERNEFLTEERFPKAKERLLLPPEDAMKDLLFRPATSIAVVTHDHVLDQRIVEMCLKKPFRYLGLIGSRVKAAKTRARLKAQGFSLKEISQLSSPMGLNLGAQTPEEIAVSIVAQLVATRHGAIAAFSWDKAQKPVEEEAHG